MHTHPQTHISTRVHAKPHTHAPPPACPPWCRSNLISWVFAGMVDYHISLGRHFAYPHMLVDGEPAVNLAALPAARRTLPAFHGRKTSRVGELLMGGHDARAARDGAASCCKKQLPAWLGRRAWSHRHRPASAPPLPAPGRDLLVVSRAAFAPWARDADAPLNDYYNNHNSNTIAFHRWVRCALRCALCCAALCCACHVCMLCLASVGREGLGAEGQGGRLWRGRWTASARAPSSSSGSGPCACTLEPFVPAR